MLSGFAVAAAFAAGQRWNGHTVTPVSVATGRGEHGGQARAEGRVADADCSVVDRRAGPGVVAQMPFDQPGQQWSNLAAGQREAGAPGGDGGAAVRGTGQQPAEGVVIRPAFVRMRPSGSGVDD
jgi:hypothetical protein